MKKLKLNLEDLKVESFETTKKSKKTKGTVVGYREVTYDCATLPQCWTLPYPECTTQTPNCGGGVTYKFCTD